MDMDYMLQPMTHLTKYLWLGNVLDAQNTELLALHGIEAIANLTGDSTGTVPRIESLVLDQCDGEPIDPITLRRFFARMDEWMAQDMVVLVHCQAGISRTPSFVIAWQMWRTEHDIAPALLWDTYLRRIARVRPIVNPSPVLRKSVLEFFVGLEAGMV